VTGTVETYSYARLQDEVGRVAAALVRLGVGRGDRVVLYMPMIPQTLFAMLACARLGAIHSVVFGGFAPHELAKRIDDATPRLVMTASCGIEGNRKLPYKPMVDEALAHRPSSARACGAVARPQCAADLCAPRDLDWASVVVQAAADPVPAPAPMASADPLYILYTSGTTARPRVSCASMAAMPWRWPGRWPTFMASGRAMCSGRPATWAGSWGIPISSMLLAGGRDNGAVRRQACRHARCRHLLAHHHAPWGEGVFTAPTAIRAIRKVDGDGDFIKAIGVGGLRAIFLAGERADPETIAWAQAMTGLPVIDHWWQTELGWAGVATCFAMGDTRRKPGSAGLPVPGYDFAILGDDGKRLEAGQSGFVAIRAPLPPGAFAPCGTTRRHGRRTSILFRDGMKRAMRVTSTAMVSFISWGVPMISSMSQAIVCPLARWSRLWRSRMAWRNARSSARMIRSRVWCRWPLWCRATGQSRMRRWPCG
jgi:propionyl-CoA synthetase